MQRESDVHVENQFEFGWQRVPTEQDRLRKAPRANLNCYPVSEEAKLLENELVGISLSIEEQLKPRQRARKPDAQKSLRLTISTFIADLGRSSVKIATAGYCYRGLSRRDLTDTNVPAETFQLLIKLWNHAGLIEVKRGFQYGEEFESGEVIGKKTWATRYRATYGLLNIVESCGIDVSSIDDHYRLEAPEGPLVVLKGAKLGRSGQWTQKHQISFEMTDKVSKIVEEMRQINRDLEDVDFGDMRAPTFRRVFNDGHKDYFDWNQGGRLICDDPEGYQSWSSKQRSSITIYGENTVEIDIRACHLTLLYGLHRKQPPEGDPYDIPLLERDVAKALTNAILGKGGPVMRWPQRLVEKYQQRWGRHPRTRFKLKDCIAAIYEAHPILNALMGDYTGKLLQYQESEIIKDTMLIMANEFVPSLPLHDCLIVGKSRQEFCKNTLAHVFQTSVGVVPRLEIKG